MRVTLIEVMAILALVLIVAKFYLATECRASGGILFGRDCVQVNLIK